MVSDAHLHLTDARDTDSYPWTEVPEMVFSCTARPSEWEDVVDFPAPVKHFYGVHPWYADEWNEEVEDRLRSILASDSNAGIGEIGMDDTRGDTSLQRTVFERQLTIASELGRTVTVHMVGCERNVLESIRRCSNGIPVILHAFKSESYVKPFAELNCYFSVGPRLMTKSTDNLRRVLSSIPLDRLLLETDAPHTPRGLTTIRQVLDRVSEVLSVTPEEISETTSRNLRRIS